METLRLGGRAGCTGGRWRGRRRAACCPTRRRRRSWSSANVRAWRTMLELRLGEGAELEIRRMAVMLPPRAARARRRRSSATSRSTPRPMGRECGRVGVPQSVRKSRKNYCAIVLIPYLRFARARKSLSSRGSLVRHRTAFFVEGPFGSSDRTSLQSQARGTGTSRRGGLALPRNPQSQPDARRFPRRSASCATTSSSPISTPSGTSPPPSTPWSALSAPSEQVIRLEADATLPRAARAARPDFVFNIAEGLYGPNREGHVPAICEFLGIPYHASDPLTLASALHKGRAKEMLLLPRRPHRALRHRAAPGTTPGTCRCPSRSS